jgi:hypothetical protein
MFIYIVGPGTLQNEPMAFLGTRKKAFGCVIKLPAIPVVVYFSTPRLEPSEDKFGQIVLINASASDIQQPCIKLTSVRRRQAFQHGKTG